MSRREHRPIIILFFILILVCQTKSQHNLENPHKSPTNHCVPVLMPNVTDFFNNFRNPNLTMYDVFKRVHDVEHGHVCLYDKESHVVKEDTFYFKDFLFNHSHSLFDIPEDLLDIHHKLQNENENENENGNENGNVMMDGTSRTNYKSHFFKPSFHYGGEISKSLKNVYDLFYNSIGSNDKMFKKSENAYHHFKNHLNKPIRFFSEQIQDYEKMSEMKTIASEFSKKMYSRLGNLYTRLTKRNIIGKSLLTKNKSPIGLYKSANHLLNSKNHEIYRWKNYEDPNNTIYTDYIPDMYYYLYSKASYLFHINNEFNQSGLFSRASPYIPIYNNISKRPIFVGPTYASFYPIGFDPNNPQCGGFFEGYNNPFYYFKSIIYIFTFYTGVAEYIYNDPNGYLAYFFSWTVYELNYYPLHLPPNMIPCLSASPFSVLALVSLASFAIFIFSLISKIWYEIRVNSNLSDSPHREIPDLASKIPRTLGTVELSDFQKIIPTFKPIPKTTSTPAPPPPKTPTTLTNRIPKKKKQ